MNNHDVTISDNNGNSVETDTDTMRKAAEGVKNNNLPDLQNLKPGDSIDVGGKQFMESPEVEKVAKKVIEEENIELGPAEISYLLVYPNISTKRAAKAKKASKELKFFTGFDFLLEISGELWDMLDRQNRYMLVWHQLLHFDPVYKAKSQEWKMKTRKPEYADYYEINEEKGSDWHKAVQATMSSLADLDPKDEGQVSLF